MRRLRRAANLTLADLADAAGTSIAYVSQVERGDKPPPSPVMVEAFASRIGCMDQVTALIALANRSRRAVEIKLQDKHEDYRDMLLLLARKSEDGEIDSKTVQEIATILRREAHK